MGSRAEPGTSPCWSAVLCETRHEHLPRHLRIGAEDLRQAPIEVLLPVVLAAGTGTPSAGLKSLGGAIENLGGLRGNPTLYVDARRSGSGGDTCAEFTVEIGRVDGRLSVAVGHGHFGDLAKWASWDDSNAQVLVSVASCQVAVARPVRVLLMMPIIDQWIIVRELVWMVSWSRVRRRWS